MVKGGSGVGMKQAHIQGLAPLVPAPGYCQLTQPFRTSVFPSINKSAVFNREQFCLLGNPVSGGQGCHAPLPSTTPYKGQDSPLRQRHLWPKMSMSAEAQKLRWSNCEQSIGLLIKKTLSPCLEPQKHDLKKCQLPSVLNTTHTEHCRGSIKVQLLTRWKEAENSRVAGSV